MVQATAFTQETSLTGKMRVRRGFFGRLVLQVEFNVDRIQGLNRQVKWDTRWRDARPADVGLDVQEIRMRSHGT